MNIFLANGADVNAVEGFLSTPLHYAVKSGHLDVSKLLIAKGADLNAKNRDGWSPLHWAAYNGQIAAVELLVAKGAVVRAADKQGKTALALALEGFAEIGDLLTAHEKLK